MVSIAETGRHEQVDSDEWCGKLAGIWPARQKTGERTPGTDPAPTEGRTADVVRHNERSGHIRRAGGKRRSGLSCSRSPPPRATRWHSLGPLAGLGRPCSPRADPRSALLPAADGPLEPSGSRHADRRGRAVAVHQPAGTIRQPGHRPEFSRALVEPARISPRRPVERPPQMSRLATGSRESRQKRWAPGFATPPTARSPTP